MAMNTPPRKLIVTAIGYALQAVGVAIAFVILGAICGLALRVFLMTAGLA